jgi:hypothetical protein
VLRSRSHFYDAPVKNYVPAPAATLLPEIHNFKNNQKNKTNFVLELSGTASFYAIFKNDN